jgi:hypothetical protein
MLQPHGFALKINAFEAVEPLGRIHKTATSYGSSSSPPLLLFTAMLVAL